MDKYPPELPPPSRRGLPAEYASCLQVHGLTALKLLEDFAKLNPGDVVLYNGATSSVGQSIAQIAKAKGLRTIGILSYPRTDYDQSIQRLLNYGDLIVTEDLPRTVTYKRLVSDYPVPSLALDCLSGPTAVSMARLLKPGGTLVSYGAMSRKPLLLPSSLLLHNNIQVKGFWLERWLETQPKDEIVRLLGELVTLVRDRKLRMWFDSVPLSKLSYAFTKATERGAERKVILDLQD